MDISLLGRIPPQNIEAERSVLGSLLIDKDIIPEVAQFLEGEDFFNELHKVIYETILDIYNRNIIPDIISVSEKLGTMQGIEKIIESPILYLGELTRGIYTTASYKNHMKIVKGKSIRRQYIKAGREIIDAAYDGEYENIIDLKNDVLQKVDIRIKDKRKPTKFKNLYSKFIDRMLDKDDAKRKFKYDFKWLDKNTGGLFTDLTVIAARPSVGKTAFVLQLSTNLARQGAKVALFNLEMTSEQLTDRVIANISKVDSYKIRTASITDSDADKIYKFSDIYNEIELDIIDDIYNLEEICGRCRELKIKEGLDVVIIDYLQLCDTMKKTTSQNEKVSHISRTFKKLQKDLGITLLLLSQLSRDNVKGGRQPVLTDLRDSGAIEQDADNVLFLHDPKNGEYAESKEAFEDRQLIIAKQRNGKKDIYTDLKFYSSTQLFCEVWQ